VPDASTFALFIAAALLIVPGPAVVHVVARSASGVRLAGPVSVFGAVAAVSGKDQERGVEREWWQRRR
jgi:threonine/homoserine/homoserine lactone efflux protein